MRSRRSKGQSLVESALVLTAFMALVLGLVGLADILFERQMLARRVQDAARWGAVNAYNPRAIRDLVLFGTLTPVRDALPFAGLESDAVEVANPGCPGADCRVRVSVRGQGVQSVQPVE